MAAPMIEAVDARARGLRDRRRDEVVGLFSVVRRLDWLLLVAMLAVLVYGLWAIDGITKHAPGGSALHRESMYAVVGLVLFVIATFVDPAFYRRAYRFLYAGLLAVLGLVLLASAATHGAKRWIGTGGVAFQPSEFGVVLMAVCVAGYISAHASRLNELSVALRVIVFAGVPTLLVFVQPDIGTALVYAAVLAAAVFVSGIRWLHLALVGGVALLGVLAVLWFLPAAGINVLKPYQAARLTGFTHPNSDPRDATYNITQSIIAVGAGKLRGQGVNGATQTTLGYTPAADTDFAFASLAEEHGFFGAAILLLLYLFVVWRGLKIVAGAGDLFAAVAAAGIVFAFLFQVFVNVGMTMGVAPITGIPLPFVSVGGSAMIANLAAFGILQAIHARGRRRRL
jgi:rod shape determining protein RodA